MRYVGSFNRSFLFSRSSMKFVLVACISQSLTGSHNLEISSCMSYLLNLNKLDLATLYFCVSVSAGSVRELRM